MNTIPTKRQAANAKRRLAKHDTVEPRYTQKWRDYYWKRYAIVWLSLSTSPNTLVRQVVCVDCLNRPDFEDEGKQWCEGCWMEERGYSDSEVSSLMLASYREQEMRFLAHYGEPEIYP